MLKDKREENLNECRQDTINTYKCYQQKALTRKSKRKRLRSNIIRDFRYIIFTKNKKGNKGEKREEDDDPFRHTTQKQTR